MSPHEHPTGHHHASHHGTDLDWATLASHLEQEAELYAPLHEQAAAWLRELLADEAGAGPDGVRRVLDIGSGPGVISCVLARAFPAAEVVAVDGSAELLERARDRAAALGLGERFRTHLADLPDGLDALGGGDVIWSSKALHHLGDQRGAIAALAGHLRPGGLLAVCEGGLPARCLPRDLGLGRPGLQSRIDAAADEWFSTMREALPGFVHETEDWQAFLADAGLRTPATRSFLLDLPAPLSDGARAFLVANLSRGAERWADHFDEEDRTTLARLTDPEDAAGIGRRPDAFLLSAQTVHTARAQ
ncbi:class I SAM-dependent methyltransferase [Streptomyces kronopolitis]|uniref:class I SAM-dependent methyltransferase n=1 Tax=Streptomyces kronopolitis TaxID=1612435 RepID=UPI0034244189